MRGYCPPPTACSKGSWPPTKGCAPGWRPNIPTNGCSSTADELAGVYADFRDAERDAGRRFGYGPYLIRQVAPTDWQEYAKELWRQRYGNG